MAGAVLADNSILLAGQNGTVLVSHSRGKTFALQKHPSQKHVAAILADGNHALLFGDTGVARFESR